MKKIFAIITLLLISTLSATAQYNSGQLAAMRNVVPDGYNFWLYAPEEYKQQPDEKFPVIIFLHGASLCGNDMNRSRRYGVLDAVEKGRKIPALIMCPQNPGGAWKPAKVNAILDWVLANTRADSTRVYVLGMSLGGYGTMDVAGTYPHKFAAAFAMCGGTTLKDPSGLGELPLWILHGTADRAVNINESKKVVNALKEAGKDSLLRYEWVSGANHGYPARYFYSPKTYEWLFKHSLNDNPKKVDNTVEIKSQDIQNVYRDIWGKDVRIESVKEIK